MIFILLQFFFRKKNCIALQTKSEVQQYLYLQIKPKTGEDEQKKIYTIPGHFPWIIVLT